MGIITLYGMRWVGKTTLGKELSIKMGKKFIDLDDYISQKVGINLVDYIESNGWDIFRQKEHECLKEILQNENDLILSLGGGTIIYENNQRIILKKSAKLIYIYADLNEIKNRIIKDEKIGNKRNSLTGKSIFEETFDIFNERKNIYEKFYDFKVDNTNTIEESLLYILKNIYKGNICVPIIDLKNIKKEVEIINSSHEIKFVELRADCFNDLTELDSIIKKINKQIIFTNRIKNEGGNFEGDIDENISVIKKYVDNCEFLDLELSNGENILEVREYLKNQELILSYHNFKITPSFEELVDILDKMKKYNPDIYKISVMPNNEEDIKIIYKLCTYFKENIKGKFVFISMGELGKVTRIEVPKSGGFLTFGLINKPSAPGQFYYKDLYNDIF